MPDYFTDDLPPAYQVASALPTYEEAELTKGKIKKEFITWWAEIYKILGKKPFLQITL